MSFLAHTHPAYAAMHKRHLMAYDFWRAGRYVLEPDHAIAKFSFAVANTTSETNVDLDAPTSYYSWGPASEWRSYLWRHRSESKSEYRERCEQAYHVPFFSPLISDVVASILRTPPTRGGETPQWENFWQDVDGCGTNIDPFINACSAFGFVWGRYHVLTDWPRVDTPATTRGEQIARGERPYAEGVSPLHLRDWSIDSRGRYRWVMISEAPPDNRQPGDPWEPAEEWIRVWTCDEWILYRVPPKAATVIPAAGGSQLSSDWEEHSRQPHGMGRVPLADIFFARGSSRRSMACESPFASQLDLDRHSFNELSEIWESDRTQGFCLLGIPSLDGQAGAPIDISPGKAVAYPVGGGAPAYISPDAGPNAERWKRWLDKRTEGRAAAGIGRGTAEQSKEQRSAEAIVEEMRGQLSQQAAWAGSIQELDRQIHKDVALANGDSEQSAPQSSYLRSFYRMAVLSSANAINQILASKVISRRAAAIMVVPVVQTFLADFGVDAKKIKEAEASIIDEAEKIIDVSSPPDPPKEGPE